MPTTTKKRPDTGLKKGKLPARPTWEAISVKSSGAQIGVDRENNRINGYVVAEEGPFKSKGRGRFDMKSLRMIRDMGNASPTGLKSRFTHPDESNDGLGKFLGRATNFRLDKILRPRQDDPSKLDEVNIVRGDLQLDPSSFETPNGDLGTYIMNLADSDPDALSSSLALECDKEYELDKKTGRPLPDPNDPDGEPLPPLWRPTRLHASDVVDTGDAVNSFLSAEAVEGLPNALAFRAAELLDKQFAGATREVVQARCLAYLNRYLDRRYGCSGTRESSDRSLTISATSRAPALGVEYDGDIQDPDEPAGEPGNFEHNDHVHEDEPAWGDVDRSKLPDLAFADPDARTYAHHWVAGASGKLDKNGRYCDGTMHLHSEGLTHAQNAAKKNHAAPGIMSHLEKHAQALDAFGNSVGAQGGSARPDRGGTLAASAGVQTAQDPHALSGTGQEADPDELIRLEVELRARQAEVLAFVLAFVHNSKVADSEPDWGSIDKSKLPRLAFADMGDAGQKSSWKFPHHWVKGGSKTDENGVLTDGTLYLHRGGLNAAWSAAQGGRSGQKAAPDVINHLQRHRKALGLDQDK